MTPKRIVGWLIEPLVPKLLELSFSGTNPLLEFQTWDTGRLNQRRLEHLATLGVPLHRTTVLEVGAGIGNLTSFFMDRGCEVTTTEARPENLKVLAARFPSAKTLFLDLDCPATEFTPQFDIVFSYGLLYHLKKPAEAIEYMARQCRGILLLDTCVSFGTHEAQNPVTEPKDHVSQAVSGVGCRPTRRWVFNQVKKHFPFVYMPETQPNHEQFPVDWADEKAHQAPYSRAVFIGSRTKLTNPQLREDVPMKQVRAG